MRFSKNFKEDEFKFWSGLQKQKLHYLCVFCLQKVRDKFGQTLVTSSGRTKSENDRVGGSPTSQHLDCEAVDFVCPKAKSMIAVYRFIKEDLGWGGQLFLYQGRGHIHVGLPRIGLRPSKGIRN